MKKQKTRSRPQRRKPLKSVLAKPAPEKTVLRSRPFPPDPWAGSLVALALGKMMLRRL